MPDRTEGRHEESPDAPERFDAEAVRRILHRAAEVDQRLESQRGASYSLEEVEEIATEVGISREAVRAAVQADRDETAPGKTRRGVLAWLEERLPQSWSRNSKHTALTVLGLGLFLLVVSLPGVGPIVLWATILTLLILMLLVLFGVLI